jgi:hypothetical protein
MSLQELLVKDLADKLGQATKKRELYKDPVAWIEKEFFIPETKNDPKLKGHLQLQPYQRDTLYEALSREENGNYKYSIIIWSDIKKSIKSTIAAAVNLARAHTVEWGEFYIVANDLKQANSRVSRYVRRSLILNPKTNPKKNRDYRASGYTIDLPNGSTIEAIPIDPSGEAGSNADQITWSELWGSNEKAKNDMWAEMTLSPTKHGQSFRWVESYAGFTGESELLWALYQTGVKNGELLWPDRLYDVTDGEPAPLELYVNKSARMLCLWNTLPRNPWQTKEYYAVEAATMPPLQFARMHRNQWVSSTETFVPMAWWNACKRSDEDWPEWQPRPEKIAAYDRPFCKETWPVIIALDAAVSGACFGLWVGCRHPVYTDEVMELHAHKWEPPKGSGDGKIDYTGTPENPGPELVLRKYLSEYNVVEVAYDQHQLHFFCSKLSQEGLGHFRDFPQGKERLIGDNMLRNYIRDRLYWHRGNPDMAEHVQNADAKIDPEDRKIRIVKRSENLHNDLAVCAAMGTRELIRLNLG